MSANYISPYRQQILKRQARYDKFISSGQHRPFLYPWDTLPTLWLILAVFFFPRLPRRVVKIVRWPIFFLILYQNMQSCSEARSTGMAGGYMLGLINAFSSVMALTLLLCNDLRTLQRLEIRTLDATSDPSNKVNGHTADDKSDHDPVVKRVNRTVHPLSGTLDSHTIESKLAKPATRPYKLVWQGYPSGITHAIDWTLDLITSMRGVGWTFRVSSLPPIDVPHPENPTSKKDPPFKQREGVYTVLTFDDLKSLRDYAIRDFVLYYMALDLLKTTMVTDPYFRGEAALSSPTPWKWLSDINAIFPIATKCLRLIVSLSGVISALSMIFSLSPLFFTWILPAMIDVNKFTKAPMLEPFMYPSQWWPFGKAVLDGGLPGFWGKFWHQMFRFGISEPGRVVVEKTGINPKGQMARAIQVLIAFSLSGFLHCCGSWTSTAPQDSFPIRGPFVFFVTQGFGILMHTALVKAVHSLYPESKSLPRWLRRTGNGMVVLVYLYFTGPFLADDFARCGIWLFEPVPFSPLRGLGFGSGGEGEGFWTWSPTGRVIGIWRGSDRWWDRNLAYF